MAEQSLPPKKGQVLLATLSIAKGVRPNCATTCFNSEIGLDYFSLHVGFTPAAMRQIFESMGANGRANQPQGQAVNRNRHAPHLAVAAFTTAQFYPRRQDGLARSHGRLSFLQARRGIYKTDTGWPRGIFL